MFAVKLIILICTQSSNKVKTWGMNSTCKIYLA